MDSVGLKGLARCGRVFEALKAMEAGLQAVGAGFAWDERLGGQSALLFLVRWPQMDTKIT